MAYIQQKRPPALTVRAGNRAFQHIQRNGLHAADVDIIPGAAGGPKGIGIQGLDQAIFNDFLAHAPKRRILIGSSIGSWRFASILAHGAKDGTERLAEGYTHLSFAKGMTFSDVSQVCQNMLDSLIQGRESQVLEHPDYHLAILSVKSRNLLKSDHRVALLTALAGVVSTNTLGRRHARHFMQRVISQPFRDPRLDIQDAFTTHFEDMNIDNLQHWLMASASIPAAMSAVRDIPHAPTGAYRDGGLIDYHIDLPYQSDGLVLYPHFTDHITPGWFDKFLPQRKYRTLHHTKTVLLAPSADYLQHLPLGRLPDRKDFMLKGLSQAERIRLWTQCIAESQRLGDEFLEMIEKQNFIEHMQALERTP